MKTLKFKSGIVFAIDLQGISIVNKESGSHEFIKYPEAAVWAVLIEHHNTEKSLQMLQAILGKNKTDTNSFIIKCLNNWKDCTIID